MEKNIKKQIPLIFIFIGCVLSLFTIFCFFGESIKIVNDGTQYDSKISMFDYMFGNNGNQKIPGLTVLFSFQLVIIFISVVIMLFLFLKILNKKQVTIFAIVLSVFLLTSIILSFCTKSLIMSKLISDAKSNYEGESLEIAINVIKEFFKYIKISSGPISYSIMSLVSLFLIGSGITTLNLKSFN